MLTSIGHFYGCWKEVSPHILIGFCFVGLSVERIEEWWANVVPLCARLICQQYLPIHGSLAAVLVRQV